MGEYFTSPIKIRFDPNSSTDPTVRKVFSDKLARTLWLGIRPRHIVDQDFHQYCLNAAKAIRERCVLESPEDLLTILDKKFGHPSYGIDFARELFPYVSGERKLEYNKI